MKNILLILSVLITAHLSAQKITTVLSDEEFPFGTISGPRPFIIMKDGKSMAIERDYEKNSITYYIYNINHKLEKKTKVSFFKFIMNNFESIETMLCNNQLVFLGTEKIDRPDKKYKILYRCIIDLTSANIISEEKIDQTEKDGDDFTTFYDKKNQTYGFLKSVKESDKRFYTFTSFNNKNEQIYKSTYSNDLNETYKSGILIGNKCAIMTFHNGTKKNSSHISLVKFDIQGQKLTVKEIPYLGEYTPILCKMAISPQQDKLLITYYLWVSQSHNILTGGGSISYDIILQPVNIDDFKLGKYFNTPNTKVGEYVASHLQLKKNTGNGIPFLTKLDHNGNGIVLKSQDPAIDIQYYGVSSSSPGIIGASVFDMNGKEISGYAIRHKYNYEDPAIFSTKKGNYVFTADRPDNYDKEENEERKGWKNKVEPIAVVYFMDESQLKKMLITDDKNNPILISPIAERDLDTGSLFTMVVNEKINTYRFAWITFE